MPEGNPLSAETRKALGDEFRDIIERSQNDDKLTEDERKKLRELLRNFDDIQKLVESRKVTVTVYTAIGEFAKWAGAVVAAIVAWKTFVIGGAPPK